MLRKLPQGSRYKSEIHMNMDLAQRIFGIQQEFLEQERMRKLIAAANGEESLDEDENDKELVPTPSIGHTAELELLMKIFDMLQVLNSTLIGVNLPKGKKPPKIRPLPRPRSALQVLEAKAEQTQVRDALSQMGIHD